MPFFLFRGTHRIKARSRAKEEQVSEALKQAPEPRVSTNIIAVVKGCRPRRRRQQRLADLDVAYLAQHTQTPHT